MKDEDKKLWPWNPPTPYDEEPPDTFHYKYSILMDLFWTCVVVAAVAAGIIIASKVFP